MKFEKGNIFETRGIQSDTGEIFETILMSKKLKIERILTLSPYDQPGEWYDQKMDEWILLLQGRAEIEYKKKPKVALNAGDYIFIPAHEIHRVGQSSPDKKCIWLAIHGNLK